MIFQHPITKQEIDTNEYLDRFVDEFTGEVNEGLRVLNKRARRLWFRSENPHSVAKQNVEIIHGPNESLAALAHVELYIDGKFATENFAFRKPNEGFEYFVEAALNAAYDRCLIDLGYVVPEELGSFMTGTGSEQSAPTSKKTSSAPATPSVTPAVQKAAVQKALSDIIEDVAPQEATPPVAFDKTTPVEEIMKEMSPEAARATVFTCNGKYSGKTVGEAYESTKDKSGHSSTLQWFADRFNGKDNVLVAACRIVNK